MISGTLMDCVTLFKKNVLPNWDNLIKNSICDEMKNNPIQHGDYGYYVNKPEEPRLFLYEKDSSYNWIETKVCAYQDDGRRWESRGSDVNRENIRPIYVVLGNLSEFDPVSQIKEGEIEL
jgi:hypothetical protein